MLRINNPELPEIQESDNSTAPGFRLFGGDRSMAPIAKINFYAPYGNTGFQPIQEPMPEPYIVGHYFRLNLGFQADQIKEIVSGSSKYLGVADPLAAEVGNFWLNGSTAHVFTALGSPWPLVVGDSVSIKAVDSQVIPTPENYIFTFSIADGFAVSRCECQGLSFLPAADAGNPQPGEFVQVSTVLTLYGSVAISPAIGSELEIEGAVSLLAPDPYSFIAFFDFTDSSIRFLDVVDYVGGTYGPASNALEPEVNQFFCTPQRAKLFVNLASVLTPHWIPATNNAYQSSPGSINYIGQA